VDKPAERMKNAYNTVMRPTKPFSRRKRPHKILDVLSVWQFGTDQRVQTGFNPIPVTKNPEDLSNCLDFQCIFSGMKVLTVLLFYCFPIFLVAQIRHVGLYEGTKKIGTHEWYNEQNQKLAEVNYTDGGDVIGFKTWDKGGYLIDDEHLPNKRERVELPALELSFREDGFGWLVVHGRADDHAPYARNGERVGIFYQGLLQDGTVFDENYGDKKPLRFKLRMGEVIPGFDEAVAMLRVGEEGYFLIPAQMAYNDRVAGIIPPYSDLLFRIKLVALN
jgi:hypothetical protein